MFRYEARTEIIESDGRTISIPLSLGRETSEGGYTLLLKEADGAYQLVLSGDTGKPLRELRLRLSLPDFFWRGDVWIYNDGTITNEVQSARPLDPRTTYRSRSFTVLKNKDTGAELGFGFLTAHRFYGEIVFEGQNAFLYFDMENKPLLSGEEYGLERFILSGESEDTLTFLGRWGDAVARANEARPLLEPPSGWCSWSVFYGNVNEENLRRALDGVSSALGGKADLFQIDAGWQIGPDFFPGLYVENRERFPSGILDLSARAREKGMKFGLWISPLVVSEASPYAEELKPILRRDFVTYQEGDVPMHPLDLDKEETYAHLSRHIAALRREYRADYFKMDFLVCGYQSIPDGFRRMYYRSDYCVALYRKALFALRRGAGDDAVLVGCGAPLLESVGILDASRVASDIIIRWGDGEDVPNAWELVKDVSSTVLHRWPYHKKAFLNDADGVVVRDFDVGDDFDPTFSEAKYWATNAALSGGSALVNEDMASLGQKRRELFTRLVPPLGMAGRPLDYFEGPHPTRAILPVSRDVCFAAIYNLNDRRRHIVFDTAEFGFDRAVVLRCWDEMVLGEVSRVENLLQPDGSTRPYPPHSAELYLLLRAPKAPCFLYSDLNVFGGASMIDARLQDGAWVIEEAEAVRGMASRAYAWVPDGCDAPGETVQTAPGGRVVRIR